MGSRRVDDPHIRVLDQRDRLDRARVGEAQKYNIRHVEKFLPLIKVMPLVLIYAEQFKIRSLPDPLINLEACRPRLAVDIHFCLHSCPPVYTCEASRLS